MKRVIIVCEGPTEREFSLNLLAPRFLAAGIMVDAPLIKHSQGGIVPWGTLRRQLIGHLHEKDAYVTTLIDYYGIKDSFKFPGWEETKDFQNKRERLSLIYQRMTDDIPPQLAGHFIPYIQLHEFEGLLFSDLQAIRQNFTDDEADLSLLQAAVDEFDCPEDINSHPAKAPSKRLLEAIPGYTKSLYGAYLAMEMGLDTIIGKCPLFASWYNRLLSI